MTRSRSVSLSVWLGTGSVAIVLIAVLFVAFTSVRLLGRLAAEQALTRVELAGASAREYLRRVNEDLLGDARALAERPTLIRLVGDADRRTLEPMLRRYCESGGLYACGVVDEEGLLGAGGGNAPWPEVDAARLEQGERFTVASRDTGLLLIGAAAPIPRRGGATAVTLRILDRKLLAELREQADAEVRVTNFATYTAPPEDPYTELHTQAISSGSVATRRLEDPEVYAASLPWSAVTGELMGLIDIELPVEEYDAAVRSLTWRLLLIALVVVALAAIAGLVYAQIFVRPLQVLRSAADRIGRGDFSVAVPAAGISEIDSLSVTMDEMRRNLVDLTTALRRREAEASALLSGVVEGVYAVDSQRVIRYANEQVARMLGVPHSEIVGRFCGDVLKPERRDGVRPCERDCPILAARSAPEGRNAERLCLGDGSVRSVVIVSAPPTDGQQVQVLRDETELESVRRARDGVLANISHEFRTPLAAQLASIELLQDGLEHMTPAEQRELFQNLERGVLRLMRLIDNLLESVRIEAGQLAIRSQTVSMPEVAEEAGALVLPLLAQRRQSIVAEWPADLPTIVGDGQRLVQVFVNLLSNASKFAPEGTPIRIGGELRDNRVAAWVEDEGPGPSENDAATVFERFRRSGDVEPDAPGLGLGLWIVRSIVERHGGEVGMERTAHRRTRFFVTLPAGEKP